MRKTTGRAIRADKQRIAAENEQQQQLHVIASDTLALSGDIQRLVTFLNRSLKDEGYIFGLRRANDEQVYLTIYRG